MLTRRARAPFRLLLIYVFVLVAGQVAFAQAPVASPTPNPVREATRPPGQEPQSPTAPPATQTVPPQAPPGTQQQTPGAVPTATPRAVPGATPAVVPDAPSTEIIQDPIDPQFPPAEQKPLPPLPNMTRLGVTSDNPIALSLNDAIKRALENNNDIEIARDDVRFAETQLRSLEGIYDPVFSITPQIDKRITPVQNIFAGGGTAGTVSTTTLSADPTLFKSFSTGGGNYELRFSNSRTSTSAANSTLNPFFSTNLALTFTQPLLRNRSIDNNRRQIRIQKKRLEQSDADFRLRTIDVISQVQRAYWDLVFALRNQQNQLANMNLSRENLRRVEAQISVGTQAPLARAEVQTELANRESALLVAVQNVSIAENNLKRLIVKDPSAPEWTAQITPTDTPSFDDSPVNLPQALKEARENRPELRRLRLENDINSIDLQYFRNQTRPQINLQTTLATTGLAGTAAGTSITPGTLVPLISGDPNFVANAFLLDQIQD